jgi:hypothetical protein
MDAKEFIFTMLAVAAGVIVAGIFSKYLPAKLKGSWESSYEENYEEI